MCYPVKYEKCGKTTWAGCGKHKDMVMSKIAEKDRCTCPREGEPLPDKPNTSSSTVDRDSVEEIESENTFKEIISKDKLVIVDFFATWCGPCKAMAPIVSCLFINFFKQFSKVSREITEVKFYKLNGDEFEDIIEEYEISGYPTFSLFKGGKMIDSKSGRLDENSLKKFIQSKL